MTSKFIFFKIPLCGSHSIIAGKGHYFSLVTQSPVQEFSEPLAVHVGTSFDSKLLSFPKLCSSFLRIYCLFFFQPSHPSAAWIAWVQLKCNAKQINRIAVRPSLETILALSVHTESRMEVTQIKCNGIKYIAQCTVTRNYWLTIFFLPSLYFNTASLWFWQSVGRGSAISCVKHIVGAQ